MAAALTISVWQENNETGVRARLVYDAEADTIMCEWWAPFFPGDSTTFEAHGHVGRTPGARAKAERAVRAHLRRTDW